jgi:hypothetical protein
MSLAMERFGRSTAFAARRDSRLRGRMENIFNGGADVE